MEKVSRQEQGASWLWSGWGHKMLRFSLSDALSSSEIPHPKGFTTVSQHHQMETKDTSALHTPTIAFVDY